MDLLGKLRSRFGAKMYLHSETMPEGAAKLLYRNGFALLDGAATLRPLDGWERRRLGRFVLHCHPDTECHAGSAGKTDGVLIGHAFDPERRVFAADRVLDDLLAAYGGEGFYDLLDRLAGRFALIVRREGRTLAFHDAMGSRSVYYARSGGVVASHAEIVARHLGRDYRDFFIPFITSQGYRQRDVKYLPGHATPYEGVRQLTPNTVLTVEEGKVSRYWPRGPMGRPTTDAEAHDRLLSHLEGLRGFLETRRLRPLIGLTAGSDSRSLFAALRSLDPFLFTWVRSAEGTQTMDAEVAYASKAASLHGLAHKVYPLKTGVRLNEIDTALGYAFRRGTGYLRGNDNPWLHPLAREGFEYGGAMFVRGFGGEVLRGFYQSSSRKLNSTHPNQLANCYDVYAGSAITRQLFRDFKDDVDFSERRFYGRDINDMFYWEHRMGVWASSAMAEADLVTNSSVGYNSRNLYETFLALPWEARHARRAFESTARALAPALYAEAG